MSEPKRDEVGEILEQLHEKLLIGWIKNDGKVHTLPSHMNNDGCTDDAKAAINHLIARKEKEARLNARYDELEKARQVVQRHNPQNTLIDVFMAFNHRSKVIANKLNRLRLETLKSKQGE